MAIDIRAERRKAAARGLIYEEATTNATPIAKRTDLSKHPATWLPLSFRYSNPIGVGGWLGGIEPIDGRWIAFVAIDGKALLWERRDADGGVVGKPVLFDRKDLVAQKSPTAASKLKASAPTFELQPSAAEGRFLIFAEGKIRTDYGMSVMTPEAGAQVIATFRKRGNDMPIDLRHGMLSEKPTLEESLAYGWIPCPSGLQYVKGEGLYAVGVQWDPKVKMALESKPPKIKYHSPAYDQDPKTGVIISLDNIAITNLPATHNLRRMAAEKGRTKMDLKEAGKALVSLMQLVASAEGEALAQAQAALDALKMALGDQVDAVIEAAQAEDPAPESQDSFLAEMPEEDRKAYEGLSDAMKAAVKAGLNASAVPEVQAEDPKVEAEKPEVQAEKPEDIEAEKPEGESVAAEKSKLSASDLALIEAGLQAKTTTTREKIVAEAIKSGRVHAGMKAHLMDPETTDAEVTKFLASKKVVTRTVALPAATRLSHGAPATKGETQKISAEQRREIERVAKITGAPVEKLIAAHMKDEEQITRK